MPIFGDPQQFLKQASSKNNDLSSLTNENQQTSSNSSATQAASSQQTDLGDQSGDNAQLNDAMNKDMQTGPGTMQDKDGIKNSSKMDVDGTQTTATYGNEAMDTSGTETYQSEEQSGMAKWIQKKVMGGTEQDPVEQETGEYAAEPNPTTTLPEGTDGTLKTIENDKSNMPKAPEPPPHKSNVPKGANLDIIPKSNLPKVPKMKNPSMPKMSMPRISRPKFL